MSESVSESYVRLSLCLSLMCVWVCIWVLCAESVSESYVCLSLCLSLCDYVSFKLSAQLSMESQSCCQRGGQCLISVSMSVYVSESVCVCEPQTVSSAFNQHVHMYVCVYTLSVQLSMETLFCCAKERSCALCVVLRCMCAVPYVSYNGVCVLCLMCRITVYVCCALCVV